ncbi:hypothetical protein EVAR_11495_1 [Eumeta japonica]|uniref:Uncharacterized protein n=1 Tax=Eumeta variegata TaxID=151549 RepID=A0A4C1TYL7_EUMVA|nr:hypothetical protein EVAR_11495_1 [Eumeta japonica]
MKRIYCKDKWKKPHFGTGKLGKRTTPVTTSPIERLNCSLTGTSGFDSDSVRRGGDRAGLKHDRRLKRVEGAHERVTGDCHASGDGGIAPARASGDLSRVRETGGDR